MNKLLTSSIVILGLTISAVANADDKALEEAVEYRQAHMTMVGANFKPLAGMMKGEKEWNLDEAKAFAADLAAVASLNAERGYPAGSSKQGSKSKAKPEIWENMDDFTAKYDDFAKASTKLNEVAADGDKDAILAQVKEVGASCKACHKEYKAKKYN